VVGLPLAKLVRILKKVNVDIFKLRMRKGKRR